MSGRDAERALDRVCITVNKNTIPHEQRSPFVTSGIRVGSAAATTRGLTFKPHLKVASDSTRPNGSSFDVTLKNFKKTIWNDVPNADRTSGTQDAAGIYAAGMALSYIDSVGFDYIQAREAALVAECMRRIAELPFIEIVGVPTALPRSLA